MSPRETPKETLGYWGYRGAEWLAMSLPERTGRRSSRPSGEPRTTGSPACAQPSPPTRRASSAPTRPTSASRGRRGRRSSSTRGSGSTRSGSGRCPCRSSTNASVMIGAENIDRALEAGKGSSAPSAHGQLGCGRPLVRGQRLSDRRRRRELKPPRLYDLFLRHREELGMRIVGLTKEGTSASSSSSSCPRTGWSRSSPIETSRVEGSRSRCSAPPAGCLPARRSCRSARVRRSSSAPCTRATTGGRFGSANRSRSSGAA